MQSFGKGFSKMADINFFRNCHCARQKLYVLSKSRAIYLGRHLSMKKKNLNTKQIEKGRVQNINF